MVIRVSQADPPTGRRLSPDSRRSLLVRPVIVGLSRILGHEDVDLFPVVLDQSVGLLP